MSHIQLKKTDVVVIGLGAAGGTAVLPMAQAGLKVVGIEAGPWLNTTDFPFDEVRNDIRDHMGRWKQNKEVPTARANSTQVATRPLGATGPMMNAVGGTGIHWMTQSWRYLPWNFQVRSKTIERYGASAIPKGSTVIDWPYTYDDLEPYYDKVEYLYGVSGEAGASPFAGPRTRPYPMPAMRRTGWTELMADGARKVGLHPYPGPAGIHTTEYKGMPACTYCGFCGWTGCYINAKAQPDLMTIPQAQKTGNLKVVALARVIQILTDNDGRVTGVTYVKGGKAYVQPANLVVIGTYAYENARLLLLSRSRAFPKGLANNNGQVGRNYMGHGLSSASVTGLFPGVRLNRYGGSLGQFTAIDDWDADNFDHSGLGFIAGGMCSATMEAKPIGIANTLPPDAPRWGSAYKSWLKQNATSVGGASAQVETLPYEDNYVDLDPIVSDHMGYPVIRITFDLKDNEKRAALFLQQKLAQWLVAAGAGKTWTFPPVARAVNTHAFGTTRMSGDPSQGVVDQYGLTHEVPNLAIVGGSTFPSTAGRNPTETIWATSYRSGEHIAKNWKSITG